MALADPPPRDTARPPVQPPGEATHHHVHSRYTDRPLDWRTRASGLGGATAVLLAIAAATFITWTVVAPAQTEPVPLVMELLPLAAPPEPVHDVPEGPARVEQAARKPVETTLPETTVILIPRVSPQPVRTQPPTEPAAKADPVPETTAPKSLPVPPASQPASQPSIERQGTELGSEVTRAPRKASPLSRILAHAPRSGCRACPVPHEPCGTGARRRAHPFVGYPRTRSRCSRDDPPRATPAADPRRQTGPLDLSMPVEFFLR